MKLSTLALAVAVCGVAQAAPISYVNWQSTAGNQVFGQMTVGSQVVDVTYTGDFTGVQLNNSGGFYYTNASTYQSANIDNAPVTTDIIRLVGGNQNVNTLTFSVAVSGVAMPIVSLGRAGMIATFEFDTPFSLESNGPSFWGNGPLNVSGNTLIGSEGHGSILFNGPVTSISWTNPMAEDWYGFTVGATEAVPEPGTMAAIGLGLAAMARRRRK